MAGLGAFFCNYVEQVILQDITVAKTAADRAKLLATGGLKIYTTLDGRTRRRGQQRGELHAAREQPHLQPYHNADTEVMVQPGTGEIKAMAENRPYGP